METIIRKIDKNNMTLEELIKAGLRELAKK